MNKNKTLSKRQRFNRNLMIAMIVISVAFGIALNMLGPQETDISFRGLSNQAISPLTAIVLAIGWGVFLPIGAYIWYQKSIDEQEAAAYRTGAFFAANAYIGVVPLWWILWRGGLLPEPNGIIIFIIFNSIWLIIWLWKKYSG